MISPSLIEQTIGTAEKSGVEIRKQCSIPIEETAQFMVVCPEEAVGEITLFTEEGMEILMPVCQGHVEQISEKYNLTQQ